RRLLDESCCLTIGFMGLTLLTIPILCDKTSTRHFRRVFYCCNPREYSPPPIRATGYANAREEPRPMGRRDQLAVCQCPKPVCTAAIRSHCRATSYLRWWYPAPDAAGRGA